GHVFQIIATDAGPACHGAISGAWAGDGECENEDSGAPGSSPGSGAEDTCRMGKGISGPGRDREGCLYGRCSGNAWIGSEVGHCAPGEAARGRQNRLTSWGEKKFWLHPARRCKMMPGVSV